MREKPSRSPRTDIDQRGVRATRVSSEVPRASSSSVGSPFWNGTSHRLATTSPRTTTCPSEVLGVQAERLLAMGLVARRRRQPADVTVVGGSTGIGQVLAAGGGHADAEAGRGREADTAGNLLAAVVVVELRRRQRADRDGDAGVDRAAVPLRRDAGVPAPRGDQRKPLRPDRGGGARIAHRPAAAAIEEQLTLARRRLGPHRGRVAVGERQADERVHLAVVAAGEGAEHRRDASGQDGERLVDRRLHAQVERIRVDDVAVARSGLALAQRDLVHHLADEPDAVGGADVGRDRHGQHVERVVRVVEQVEIADVRASRTTAPRPRSPPRGRRRT